MNNKRKYTGAFGLQTMIVLTALIQDTTKISGSEDTFFTTDSSMVYLKIISVALYLLSLVLLGLYLQKESSRFLQLAYAICGSFVIFVTGLIVHKLALLGYTFALFFLYCI